MILLCKLNGSCEVAGRIGSHPARIAVGGRLSPIFTADFVQYLSETTTTKVSADCGVGLKTVSRWRLAAGVRGWCEQGRENCRAAAVATTKIRKEKKPLPAKKRRDIAKSAALARWSK